MKKIILFLVLFFPCVIFAACDTSKYESTLDIIKYGLEYNKTTTKYKITFYNIEDGLYMKYNGIKYNRDGASKVIIDNVEQNIIASVSLYDKECNKLLKTFKVDVPKYLHCENEVYKEYKVKADKITYSFDYDKSISKYKVTFSNVDEGIYIKYDEKVYNRNKDSKIVITVKEDSYESFEVYDSVSNCNYIIKIININIPKYYTCKQYQDFSKEIIYSLEYDKYIKEYYLQFYDVAKGLSLKYDNKTYKPDGANKIKISNLKEETKAVIEISDIYSRCNEVIKKIEVDVPKYIPCNFDLFGIYRGLANKIYYKYELVDVKDDENIYDVSFLNVNSDLYIEYDNKEYYPDKDGVVIIKGLNITSFYVDIREKKTTCGYSLRTMQLEAPFTSTCNYEKYVEYSKLANNISYELKYVDETDTYTLDVYNVIDGIYLRGNNGIIDVYNGDSGDRQKYSAHITGIVSGSTYEVDVNENQSGCNGLLRTITVSVPYYNTYYGSEECEEFVGKLSMCTYKFLSYKPDKNMFDLILKNYDMYEIVEPDPPGDDGIDILQLLKDFALNWGIKIIIVVSFTMFTIVPFNAILRKMKHGV